MIVLCVGVDHRTAPLEMRERLAYSMVEAEELYRNFAAGRFGDALPLHEVALLSTCNRVELYGAVPDERATAASTDAMWRALWRGKDGAPDAITPQGYAFTGSHAERHLCRVAAGLESMILGEAEILGQVVDAFALARRACASGPALEALSNAALRAGRRARHRTSIGRNPASVSSVAVDLAAALAPELHGRRVLILGAGKMARTAAELLVARGEWRISIASRTLESARALAERVHGEPIALDALPHTLADADLVVACSSSPAPILGDDLVRAAMRDRADRLLAILDIAVPRDVDPAVRLIQGVRLYDVDELRPRVAELSARRREEEIPRVEAIVEHEVQQLATRRSGAALLSIVDAWRGSAEDTRRREVQRAWRAMPDRDEAVRESLERFSVALVKRLLDEPSRRLRAEAANGHAELYAELARRLFAFEESEAAQSQPIRAKA
ncbi:MAG: glutamyl-tRNA reductase [Gemmatimonadaceae bacterium]